MEQPSKVAGDTAGEKWPRRGEGFPANNVWYADAPAFLRALETNGMMWLRDSDLKYLNVRIDTRSGHFVLSTDSESRIEIERVLAALKDAYEHFGIRPWPVAPATPSPDAKKGERG